MCNTVVRYCWLHAGHLAYPLNVSSNILNSFPAGDVTMQVSTGQQGGSSHSRCHLTALGAACTVGEQACVLHEQRQRTATSCLCGYLDNACVNEAGRRHC